MLTDWKSELWQLILFILVAWLSGWLLGLSAYPALIVALGYIGWHFFNLYRLIAWFQSERYAQLPDSQGIWGGIFDDLHRNQKHHRERERRLKGYLSKFEETTAVAPDATIVLNGVHGEIAWWNPAATRLFGLRSPDDKGQRVANLIRNPQFTEYFALGNYNESLDLPIHDNLQETIVSIRLVPYGNHQRLLIARDITDFYHFEQRQKDFVANVSHELRTPITVLLGYLEMILDRQDSYPKEWEKALQAMMQQTNRMQRLVNNLLFLSRLEQKNGLSLEEQADHEVDVPTLLESVLEEAKRLSGDKKHHIDATIDNTLTIIGNYHQLLSAFANLVQNAVQYTPPGGEIHLAWYRHRMGIYFQVHDTGIGIPDRHLPRITERFYRVDAGRSRDTGGTGLGLAIVKQIITRHHGTLHIESEEGHGSTFTCRFPLARLATEESSSALQTPDVADLSHLE